MSDSKKPTLAQAILILALIPVGVMVRGWVLSVLWWWFVSPLGVSGIGLWHAAGISMGLSWLLYRTDVATKDENWKDTSIRLASTWIFAPLLVLGFGWIYHALQVMP